MTFGQKLKRLRTRAGLTADGLARSAKLTDVALYSHERGGGLPSLASFRRLAKALDVGLDEFADVTLPDDARKPRQPGSTGR